MLWATGPGRASLRPQEFKLLLTFILIITVIWADLTAALPPPATHSGNPKRKRNKSLPSYTKTVNSYFDCHGWCHGFCKTIRWANTGGDIWNANILQGAPYFYILQPPQQDNKSSLPKEFWTRLMVMDFCNNKQTKQNYICPTAPGKEKLQCISCMNFPHQSYWARSICQTTHCP